MKFWAVKVGASLVDKLIELYLGEAVVYLAATINIRACSKGWIKSTLATDAIIAGLNFSLVVWIAQASSITEQLAYILGAVTGSATGMWLTRKWADAETS